MRPSHTASAQTRRAAVGCRAARIAMAATTARVWRAACAAPTASARRCAATGAAGPTGLHAVSPVGTASRRDSGGDVALAVHGQALWAVRTCQLRVLCFVPQQDTCGGLMGRGVPRGADGEPGLCHGTLPTPVPPGQLGEEAGGHVAAGRVPAMVSAPGRGCGVCGAAPALPATWASPIPWVQPTLWVSPIPLASPTPWAPSPAQWAPPTLQVPCSMGTTYPAGIIHTFGYLSHGHHIFLEHHPPH